MAIRTWAWGVAILLGALRVAVAQHDGAEPVAIMKTRDGSAVRSIHWDDPAESTPQEKTE